MKISILGYDLVHLTSMHVKKANFKPTTSTCNIESISAGEFNLESVNGAVGASRTVCACCMRQGR